MSKELYIFGASGFAKEVFQLAKSLNYEVKAFLNKEDGPSIKIMGDTIPVIKEDEIFNFEPSEVSLAMGVGLPNLIEQISNKFKEYNFPNLIHKSSSFSFDSVQIGKGNIITANTIFTIDIEIGDYNIFNLATTVGHDVKIGNCNVINPSVNISGNVTVGSNCLIGVGAVILQNKSIGNNSIVGGSSLVTKNVEDKTTVIGIPAKKMEK